MSVLLHKCKVFKAGEALATTAKNSLHAQLSHYKEIRTTSQVVRNYLTTIQQYQLTERVIAISKRIQED